MHFNKAALPLLAASMPLAEGRLNYWAKKAGLLYFGAATDSPGQRERAGLEEAYPQYDAIFADDDTFGQTTPTNGQKWLFTEPEQGVFNWTEGEIVSSLAEEQDKILRCHALVWHSQLAPWVEEKTDWTPETLTAAIKLHIQKVAGHWKGRCYAWDVVNEALEDDGTWRQSVFYKVLGTDYIKIAFEEAAKVDPEAKLYYNDYNLERPGRKSAATVKLVKMLQDDGIRIDGVGMQAHTIAGRSPSIDDYIAVIDSYAETGVEVALTELDIRIQLPLNETNLEWQKADYRAAVGGCAQSPACVGITLWDFYDPFSWVPYVFEGQGAALLWFDDFTPHPAYYGALAALKNATGACDVSCPDERSFFERRKR
jgi:endo-1,4-beta-xylanase